MMRLALQIGLVMTCIMPSVGRAQQATPDLQPVKVVAPARVDVPTSQGLMQLAVHRSADWSQPLPEVTRAVLVFHGILRNADVYYAGALAARALAGPSAAATLMIAPQFLSDADATAFPLAPQTLVWSRDSWSGGATAIAPVPVSSFEAIDALLAKLADNRLFPNLTSVVIAGHSGGGDRRAHV